MAKDISEESVEKAYARWAPVYDMVFGKVFDAGRKASIAAAEKIGGRILDVGVGTGISLPDYRRDIRLVGVDYSAAMLKKAQERAGMYAAALGKRVKRIVSINEGGGMGIPGPMPMMKMAAMDAGSPPVSPGETSLSATLEVVFELGD